MIWSFILGHFYHVLLKQLSGYYGNFFRTSMQFFNMDKIVIQIT